MEEQPDARLVEQTLLDNKEAFTVLVERYQLMSLCIVKRYVANEEVARELVQEALLQAYLSLHQLRDGNRFKNWFYGITLNICRNWLRQQKNSAVLYAMAQEVDQALSSNPEEVLLEQELRHIVSEAVAILTPGNREVAQLFYYEDLGLQEIARQKNLSLAAVKNRLYKSREQLRAYLQTQYPELATRVVRANRRGKTIMIPVTVAKVQGGLFGTIVVLVDEQKERAIPFRYRNQSEYGPDKPLQKNAVAGPLTMDFIVNVIHGLGGTIEEMEIDALQEEIIYARLCLHSRKGERSTINTRLDDALSLAVHLNTPISIAEELMDRSSMHLAEKGETREQQLEAVVAMKRHMPFGINSLLPPITSTKPRNLDFTQGLAGWQTMSALLPIDVIDAQLDPQTLYRGQQSLRIKYRNPPSLEGIRRSMLMLQHEGFLADEYRGKRVRMVAYCKASEVKSARFKLSVSEPDQHWRWAVTPSIEGTNDWQRQEVVMEIPENAKKITISFHMQGKGSVWVSGMQFAVVDESVPLSHFEISPSPSQPQNMDFQQGLQYWKISSSTPQDYDYGVEQEKDAQGMRSAYIKTSKEEPRSPLTLQQSIKAKDYTGKRVRLSGRLRASGIVEQANLYISIGQRRIERSIEGTKDWMLYEMTLLVPNDAYSLELGLTLYGRGQVWLQGLTLAVVED